MAWLLGLGSEPRRNKPTRRGRWLGVALRAPSGYSKVHWHRSARRSRNRLFSLPANRPPTGHRVTDLPPPTGHWPRPTLSNEKSPATAKHQSPAIRHPPPAAPSHGIHSELSSGGITLHLSRRHNCCSHWGCSVALCLCIFTLDRALHAP